jgi:AraC-type DNA-binding domain-containing proteins
MEYYKMLNYDDIFPQIGYFIYRRATPNWVIEDSVIDFIDLTYILDGRATYVIDNKAYAVEKGDLLCIPNKSRRYAVTDQQHLMSSYATNFQLFSFKGEEIPLPFPLISKINISNELLSLYNDLNIEWLQKNTGYKMKVRAIFLCILHNYFNLLYYKKSPEPLDPRIKKSTDFIHENFTNHIDVLELADKVGLNSVYFGTLFKKNTGLTTKEYINQIRINNAENMIASGEFLVQEAASKCGFDDIFYFSKVFKNIKGYSPSKVKKYQITTNKK